MARVPVTCSGPRRPGHWLSDSVRRCDEALRLSKRFQGYQRAGDVTPQIVVVNGLDSIDVSAVDTSFIGHSYYGDNASVICDIVRVMRSGSPPDQRCGLKAVGSGAMKYWMFLAGVLCPLPGT